MQGSVTFSNERLKRQNDMALVARDHKVFKGINSFIERKKNVY